MNEIYRTDCISNGVPSDGEKLDHKRADHPKISSTPQKPTVGNNHHMR